MSTVAETRAAIAAALNDAIDGANVKPYAVPNNIRPGDGWVTSPRLTPDGFRNMAAEWDVVIVLHTDPTRAEQRYDELAPLALSAGESVPGGDVSVQGQLIPAGDGVPQNLYTLVLTLTTEVTAS